ncbi:hypothetical protein SB49_05200 [Sediminicola sp. YIK13]|uniref:hypothetical protein n=1 Tax=Sediminicola sp. YIK13 TaxID=1453352 RepID=UPI00071F63ED|nr:hypothetical protein [Sediminicola sp. YIK13]ALM07262.1 hypothetical protein SB49_05200 [Sediminicola sp. YIK13]
MLKTLGIRLVVLLVLLPILWSSCRKDFEYSPSAGNLEFSKDTVYLDTIFSKISSSTYSLKVYNRSKKDLLVPRIELKGGIGSSYRLNVDGVAGSTFFDIPILAKDSIYIFIENTLDITETAQKEYLSTDAIVFDSGANLQQVELVTLIRDAVFLFPGKFKNGPGASFSLPAENGTSSQIEGFVLPEGQLDFTNQKPYVIYGYATVGPDKTLLMDAGTRVYFHKNSGLIIGKDAALKINGALSEDDTFLENEVILEGDRLERTFADVPGQWGSIWLTSESRAVEINYLTIRNATTGLLVEGNDSANTPTLTIKNTKIYNSSHSNLWARTGTINGENLVLGNAGNSSLKCEIGGSYTFTHCTIGNYFSSGFRLGPALQISNYQILNTGEISIKNLKKATFENCIITGSTTNELSLMSETSSMFTIYFNHSLITSNPNTIDQGNPNYNFNNDTIYRNIILNQNSDFKDTSKNEFNIGFNSAGIGKGAINKALMVPLDILGFDRTNAPDLGAYQFIEEN